MSEIDLCQVFLILKDFKHCHGLKMAAVHHFEFVKVEIFNGQCGRGGTGSASSCRISGLSVKP